MADAATGQTGADHDRSPLARVRRGRLVTPHHVARCIAAFEPLALAAEARPQRQVEAGCGERVAHGTGGAPGRKRGTRAGQPRHGAQQRRRPHLRVARGRKAVEIEGIGTQRQLRHQRIGLAQRQRQRDCAAVEAQPLQPADRLRPLRRKQRGQIGQRRRRGGTQAVGRYRMRLDRHDVQPPRPLRIVAPSLPGRKKVDAEAEAGLQHDELIAPAPALQQAAAGEEHLLRLRQRAVAAGIDVAIAFRKRRAVAPRERLGHDRGWAHREFLRDPPSQLSARSPKAAARCARSASTAAHTATQRRITFAARACSSMICAMLPISPTATLSARP